MIATPSCDVHVKGVSGRSLLEEFVAEDRQGPRSVLGCSVFENAYEGQASFSMWEWQFRHGLEVGKGVNEPRYSALYEWGDDRTCQWKWILGGEPAVTWEAAGGG